MDARDLPALLTGMRRAARTGQDLSAFSARTLAHHTQADCLTLTLISAQGALEVLWADPADHVGLPLEDLQYTLGEGPTVDAAHTHHLITVPDLHTATRWPALADAAPAARAIAALPVRLGVIVPAVLTACRTTPTPFTPDQLTTLTTVTHALIHPLLHTTIHPTDTGPGTPDLLRAEVHQAAGITAADLDIPIEQALLRLRSHAFAGGRPLREIAHDVVTGRLHLDPT
ncbi:ANTAR domain-containing protein [Streptomyces kunmingensis]|uniref:ANTAR domain-containing protein n=1 Tax=Streptomyces kunmingensis TaxID=68225 RepID=A0ABU6C1S0_9ACTN|nr:ANTAR domain-containing protein [Streptomyces kunmingensis]MEB3958661.1 ANTAR domain-containing protein [Streptomyces kunmingensis]